MFGQIIGTLALMFLTFCWGAHAHAKALRWAHKHWFNKRVKAAKVAAKSLRWFTDNLRKYWW